MKGESQEMWMSVVLGHLEADLGDSTYSCYYVGWKQEELRMHARIHVSTHTKGKGDMEGAYINICKINW